MSSLSTGERYTKLICFCYAQEESKSGETENRSVRKAKAANQKFAKLLYSGTRGCFSSFQLMRLTFRRSSDKI